MIMDNNGWKRLSVEAFDQLLERIVLKKLVYQSYAKYNSSWNKRKQMNSNYAEMMTDINPWYMSKVQRIKLFYSL